MDATTNFENIFKDDPIFLNVSDGKLHTEDGYVFRIHKFPLAKRCKYFFTLFCEMGNSKQDYLIPGISGEVLSNVLTYIYTKKIHVTEKNICDVMKASDFFSLDDLLTRVMCLLEKNLSVSNCLDIYLCLIRMSRTKFLKESYRIIETHFEEIVRNTSETFCDLPLESLKQFFDDRNLRVGNENVVWQAIIKWVEADLSNRLYQVPDLLLRLKISDVDESLAAEILTHDIVTKNAFCQRINFRSTADYRNLLKLHQFFVWNDTPFFSFYIPRKPLRLNFIADVHQYHAVKAQIYVSYDKNVDLWHKIIEVDLWPCFLASVDDCIYLFDVIERKKCRFNVIEKQWLEFGDFNIPRSSYVVVTLGRNIYILGIYDLNDRHIYDVEIYDPEENAWHLTTPMLHIVDMISAVTVNGAIYIVGTDIEGTRMCAQKYDPSTEIWNELPGPSVYRGPRFGLAAFSGKIYLTGGTYVNISTNVEVFDTLHNVWYSIQNLPYIYKVPRALIVNYQLVVCEYPLFDEYQEVEPPVLWNAEQKWWETISEASPLFNIHRYIFTVQDGDNINVISKENKMPTAVFEKSPFILSNNED